MPRYEYFCEENQQTVEVSHPMDHVVKTWGEICQLAAMEPGQTPTDASVKKLISRPNIAIPTSNTDLKAKGFTKLVRRDKGVYENVTATDKEKRYFNADDPSSMPDLKSKIKD